MVDIYRSRRTKNYRCLYWKRKIILNQEELEHRKNVSGVFYATITTSKSKDIQDIANVFRVGVEEIVLQTEDIVNLEPDDKVLFNTVLLDESLHGFLDQFFNTIKENLIELLKVSNPQASLVFEYAMSGIFALMRQWLKNPTTSFSEVAKILAKLSYTNLQQFKDVNN